MTYINWTRSIIGLLILGGLFACNSAPTMCERFYDNGRLKYRVPCDGGVYNGLYEEYNRSGDLWVTRLYVDGKVEDTVRYYYSRTGELLKTVPMTANEKDGVASEYYKTGELKRQQTFAAGMRVGEEKHYYEDGKTYERLITYSHKDGAKEGPYRRQDEAGNLILEGSYRQGRANGTWTYYSSDGKIVAQIGYEDGKRTGDFAILRPNGQPYLSGRFQNGHVDSKVSYHRASGAVFFTEVWKGGTNLDFDSATGLDQSYHEDEIGFYHHGDRLYIFITRDSISIRKKL